MSSNIEGLEFFVVGGTLNQDSPSYIERLADDALFSAALTGEFCYVLTARQMGKSSLMVRTARRLNENGIQSAIIDLTKIGTGMPAEQWYLGLLISLSSQLQLQTNPQGWWHERADFSPVQRFTEFLHEIVLAESNQPIVIFIDEIDTTLRLDFSDDFFAAIRSVYNARATDPIYNRLTFILLGVALPTDLIKDRHRTPFNIGLAIDLDDFRKEDAQPLQQGLQAVYGQRGAAIFDRIFYWTGGHPYLTQKLCATIAARPSRWTNKQIDLLVERLFLTEEARREANLQFIRNSVTTSPQQREIVTLYRQVYENKQIIEDERSLEQNQLKLFGLVKARDQVLQVRNRLYRQVFDLDWIKANTPIDWTRRILLSAVATTILLLAIFGFTLWRQAQQADAAITQNLIGSFNETTNSVQRLGYLAELFELGEGAYKADAFALYDGLSIDEKTALFTIPDPNLQSQLEIVIENVYVRYLPNTADTTDNNQLLKAMQLAISQSGNNTSTIGNEIEHWVDGRNSALQGDHETAVEDYDTAIGWNRDDNNPAVYFDRAISRLTLGQNEQALTDLEKVLTLNDTLELGESWYDQVTNLVSANEQLRSIISNQPGSFPHLESVVE